MSNQDTDWKEKFRNLNIEFESLERTSEDTNKIFCRTLIRLAMSVKGLDSSLDPYIERIHETVKKDCGPGVRKKLDDLSDSMIRAADSKKSADPFETLLGHLAIDGSSKSRAKSLWKQIAADPAGVQSRTLEELSELMAKAGPATQKASDQEASFEVEETRPEKKGGLFSKLFSSHKQHENQPPAARVEDNAVNPNNVLRDLLLNLNWPTAVEPQIKQLVSSLSDNASQDTWIEVITQVNRILADALSSFQSEVQSAEKFLSDLAARLQEIDGFVQAGGNLREASLESGRALGKTMTEQVDGISSSMASATDLNQLKDDVARHLDVIQSHVSSHLASEEERFKTAQQREQELTEKLSALEDEAGQLRQQIQEASAKAVRDAVTRLPNRQAYDDRIEEEFARWKRFNEPLALVVWDIDDFKKINDKFGHQSGDKALRVMAEKLSSILRETDFIARYGGEEFVVLLVGTDLSGAKEVAEKMRVKVEQTAMRANKEKIKITISGGISMFQQGDLPADVFERADQALYKAKKEGKNRWVVG